MSESLTIRIDGQQQFFASLDAFAGRGQGAIGAVAPQLHSAFARHVGEQFAAEGGRTGERWGLSAAYARRKAQTHPGKPVMQREGKLLASLTDAQAEGAIFEVRPDSVTFGSSLPYAAIQGQTHDLLGAREEDAAEYLTIIEEDLTAYAVGLGLRP